MYRTLALSVALAGFFLGSQTVRADVFVRVPFVRVEVGEPGVFVHAPFVNLWIPQGPPPVYQAVPPGPPPAVQGVPQNPPPVVMPPADLPRPQLAPNNSPPPPVPLQGGAPTLQEFAQSFQAKAGTFNVTILNPINKQPTQVQFTLPEAPRRVIVNRDEIEFRYGPLRHVRIQFDANGATVISRY